MATPHPLSDGLAAADLLQAVLVELRAIRGLLEARRSAPADPAADARLFGAIAGVIGGALFASADLRRHARRDPELAAALGGASVRAIGARLRRLNGRQRGPYVLHRHGRDGDGALWMLVGGDRHTGSRAPRAEGAP